MQDTSNVVRMLLMNESMTGQNIVVDCMEKFTFGLRVHIADLAS